MRRWFAGSLVGFVALAGPAVAQSHSDEQERLCTGDAFRLCSSEIPNEERIVACMTRQRHLLSAACRAVFDDPAPAMAGGVTPVSRAKSRKPMQLVPE